MKIADVRLGMLVAVNDLDIGTVYRVEGFRGFAARLSYTTKGQRVDAGYLDVGVLQRPTLEQLAQTEEP